WLQLVQEEGKEAKRQLGRDYADALQGEFVRGINATLEVAKNLRSIATGATRYDRDPALLTTGNGTINLETGELRHADPEDLITRATHIQYDPSATCPRWLQFLNEIFPGDPDLVEFIQRAIGYSLTGHTGEQCMFILYGNGANGKTTFLETVRRLLGTHAV